MFVNYAAHAGVVASNASTSPNIITPTLTWDFNDVLVMDFNPPGVENINDRPRINIWRDVNGEPDFNYLKYISGGKDVLSPAPTGEIVQIWGDRRTGSITFPTTSIGENITAGIDLFTHPFATPVNITPPLNEWTVDSTSVSGEIKYQYIFKTGEKYPEVNIELDYDPSCLPINIPTCGSEDFIAYSGTGIGGCPIFGCVDSALFIGYESGSLYNNETWINGANSGGFGSWTFYSGGGSFRTISGSTQNGRSGIGSEAFYMVGNSGNIGIGHTGTFIFTNNFSSGQSISVDVNYSWFKGGRYVSFITGLNPEQYLYRVVHSNSDALTAQRVINASWSPISTEIVANAYNKAYTYELINYGNAIEFNVLEYNTNNIIYTNTLIGEGINFNMIKGLSFYANLDAVPAADWYNYGMFFNNIKYRSGISF